jgi:hypothetical protein
MNRTTKRTAVRTGSISGTKWAYRTTSPPTEGEWSGTVGFTLAERCRKRASLKRRRSRFASRLRSLLLANLSRLVPPRGTSITPLARTLQL